MADQLQRYERRSPGQYRYESPATGYAGLPTVTEEGFVSDDHGVWRAEVEVAAGSPGATGNPVVSVRRRATPVR